MLCCSRRTAFKIPEADSGIGTTRDQKASIIAVNCKDISARFVSNEFFLVSHRISRLPQRARWGSGHSIANELCSKVEAQAQWFKCLNESVILHALERLGTNCPKASSEMQLIHASG